MLETSSAGRNPVFKIFRYSGYVGAVIMLIFTVLAGIRWYQSGLLFYLLLFLRDFIIVYLLIFRNSDRNEHASLRIRVISYISTFLPLLYMSSSELIIINPSLIQVIYIIGFFISTMALLDLGSSFGVSPANRGFKKNGLYKFLKHPMYLGYGIAEFGMILLNPFNTTIYLVSISLYYYRSKVEDLHFQQKFNSNEYFN